MQWAEINGLKIGVCGLKELPARADAGVTHLISIWNGTENGEEAQKVRQLFDKAEVLFLFFNDVTETEASYPPSREDVGAALRWSQDLKKGDRLLVHCSAGVSRSTALAFSILCQHWGRDTELECFAELMAIRPIAAPNPMVVALADELLARNGQMRRAITDNPFEDETIPD